ncbi:CoA transferase [Mycobacterium yunnanensis]|uniref:CoA transferase n=1 Tax=Mycobacterium yunnanensis TaxID=368477 RepID=A0A9X2Z6Z5_9MYCO|nr:CoA transferase [Mycobacterium yunnanensis]MCV7423221.1 CoA transferase [Mycobacterium yunnanensis]
MTPLGIPSEVLSRASGVAAEIQSLAGVSLDAHHVLTGRARLLAIAPHGQVSAGGATHLLRTLDDWCAITLSRNDDVDAVPALVEQDRAAPDPWSTVQRWAATRSTAQVVQRARLLDVPAAALNETAPASPTVSPSGVAAAPRSAAGLLVADLTSMWAGPLCGLLLARAGAVVVKVESPRRPDGTRRGHRAFFDSMNGDKLSYAVDFDRDVEALRELLSASDVILEGSRPAALLRRRVGPSHLEGRPGRVWLRISGYGTRKGHDQRPAFGDDAAVAGGLVRWAANRPVFCGDAIADPLTGITAAREVFAALARGGGELIEVAMAQVAATYAALPAAAEVPFTPSVPPEPCAAARDLGADNGAVRQLLAERTKSPC